MTVFNFDCDDHQFYLRTINVFDDLRQSFRRCAEVNLLYQIHSISTDASHPLKRTIMKRLYFLLIAFFPLLAICQNKDLPNPVSDLQTLPAGSYVIAMDNNNQLNTAGDFNLNSYGLVVCLLNHSVKVKWVIACGKAKDGIDFSVAAAKIKPVAGLPAAFDFKAGPFVIYAQDTAGVSAMIDSFYYNPTGSTPAVSLTGANRPSVYKTSAAVTVDVRYNLYGFKPKAAILTDGGNQKIHAGFMATCSIPDTSWRYSQGTDLLTHCFTFASEPHNDKINTPGFTVAIQGIRAFVEYGGNFLAQCAAVENYENNLNYGHFQTDAGVTHINQQNGNDRFVNNDLSFAQYEGNYHATQTGHMQSWNINKGWSNNGYMIQNDPADPNGTDNIGASVSKLKEPNIRGGMVFYIGNHDFPNITHIEDINGIRMYMNAFLTPVTINVTCTIGGPVPITWVSFTANKIGSDVMLEWKTQIEINNKYFYVERSVDGIRFTTIAHITGNTNYPGIKVYQYKDASPGNGTFYYRIRQQDYDGAISYSNTRVVQFNGYADDRVLVYPNPGNGNFNVVFENNYNCKEVAIYDKTGIRVFKSDLVNKTSFQLNLRNLSSGIYTAVFTEADGASNIVKKLMIIK